MSIRATLIKNIIVKKTMKELFDPTVKSIDSMRTESAKMARKIKIPKIAYIVSVKIDEMNAEWIRHSTVNNDSKKVILYFHSGAFCMGYDNPNRDLALRISKLTETKVLLFDYRLAPEYQYPAANDDCIKAYKWLLNNGYQSREIVFLGDSAGAGLMLMTLTILRKSNMPMPAASVFLSLFGGDLINFNGESYSTNKCKDPSNTIEGIKKFGNMFLGSAVIKPAIEDDMTGLTPMLIQIGGDEILLSDSVKLSEKAKNDGIDVKLEIYPGMWHLFQTFAMFIPEAKSAIENIGIFIRSKLANK